MYILSYIFICLYINEGTRGVYFELNSGLKNGILNVCRVYLLL